MTNSFTKSIAVFEKAAAMAKSNWKIMDCSSQAIIMERDEEQERFLWAIETLHAAHIQQTVGHSR